MVLRVSRYGGDFAKGEAVGAIGRGPYRSWPEHLLAAEHETPRVPGWRAALAASDFGLEPSTGGRPRRTRPRSNPTSPCR